jgi:hypothetical protein
MKIKDATRQELIDFIMSLMTEEEANKRFTDWALSSDQLEKFLIELMEG